jgi:hypothetical protein
MSNDTVLKASDLNKSFSGIVPPTMAAQACGAHSKA